MKKCAKVFSVILAVMMLASLAACGAEKVKITPTAARSIETEVYETADFSITIPKGWVVTTGGENIYHSIRVYDPEEPMNQMFSLLKADVLLHSQEGKKAWQYMASIGSTGASLFAQAAVLGTPSTEGFYQIFPDYTAFVMQVESSYAGYTFPTFNDFTVTEHFPFTSGLSIHALGEELLRGTFTDGEKSGEGLFAATVVDFGSITLPDGTMGVYQPRKVDGGYYMAYNIMAVTAVKDTLQYSESFVSAANQASNEGVALSQQISQSFNETMDGMMSSWESRNKSQDILSQKQSDATLGYERFYDTETGEIYRAAIGFGDSYDGKRYQPVTDDNMYTEAISGYIERLG